MSDEYVRVRDDEDEDDEGEDLFGDQLIEDYQNIHEGNQFEPDFIDDTPVESQLSQIEEERRSSVLETQLFPEEDMVDDEDEIPDKKDKMIDDDEDEDETSSSSESDSSDSDDDFDREEDGKKKGSLRDWLSKSSTRKWIEKRFRKFLRKFKEPGAKKKTFTLQSPGKKAYRINTKSFYTQQINHVLSRNTESLVINFQHMVTHIPEIAKLILDAPDEVFPILREATNRHIFNIYPHYRKIAHQGLYLRIKQLPVSLTVRGLRDHHLKTFVSIRGVVTRRSKVYPQMQQIFFRCTLCRSLFGPVGVIYDQASTTRIQPPTECSSCNGKKCFVVDDFNTIYNNFQKVTLQEPPNLVPPGRIPQQRECILVNDLIDQVRPGEEVIINGCYKFSYDCGLNAKQGFPVFKTNIFGNFVDCISARVSDYTLSELDKLEISQFQKDPRREQKILDALAPSIFGHDNIKLALVLALFGGIRKETFDHHIIRGDINVLIMGDPGTAKSQFLKYIEQTASRAIYTTGKGSTAVGLTAAVKIDSVTKEWTLEGGALVLADKGLCLIDEFDKMNEKDRTSIHEAMEQQTISISKAGIVTTLQARCGVIAAANPVRGRYDVSSTFRKNVNLTDAILSRFDILCIVRDVIDEKKDFRLANFVLDSHIQSHPAAKYKEMKKKFEKEMKDDGEAEGEGEGSDSSDSDEDDEDDIIGNRKRKDKIADEDRITQDFLKKYIIYQKDHCKPEIVDTFLVKKLERFYVSIRAEAKKISGGIDITVRHLESMFRMAEAHAKIMNYDEVKDENVDVAIRVLLNSFLSSQKLSIGKKLRSKFRKYLIKGKSKK